MDLVRALQLITEIAYVLLGIVAVRAAIRHRERGRTDVALLFGALGGLVVIQQVLPLLCNTPLGCLQLPVQTELVLILALLIPYALLRLVDDVADLPPWQMWLALVFFIALAALTLLSARERPGWFVLLLTAYLVVGTVYAASAFVQRARNTRGITRRRMAVASWGCALLAATFVLGILGQMVPEQADLITPLSRICGLLSGLCFWAGFFPPNWLGQAWRGPELLEYLRPTRLMASDHNHGGLATEAMALDRLTAATARTTGARRVFLVLDDPIANDMYLWGAPSARVNPVSGLIGQALRSRQPLLARSLAPESLPESIVGAFASETLPRTAILVPILIEGRTAGVLAAFADKNLMFAEDDLEVAGFFAGEAAAILQLRSLRETANELAALREADRLKDEFMAVVSHELRTPLTAISGYADILMRKLSGPLTDRQERQVTGIRDAARRLLALINDLLDVSKLEAGTLDLHLASVDPQHALVRAVSGTRVIAAAKGVTLAVREPTAEVPRVRADEERLQQILSNLLVNAVKFTPQGGSVWVSAQSEASQLSAGGEDVVFRVEDTGVGLAPGHVERVWDRFYQVESSSTRRFGGAGLGLSIVRRLSELHGGRVEATSLGVDRGSTFLVRLPAATEPPPIVVEPPELVPIVPLAPPEAAAAVPRNGYLVLVVEDDRHIATVLRTYLEADGYSVEVVADGQQALQAARSLEPFAITLDISLPKLDGWSVLNALKREPATAHIPVVIVSIVDNRDFGMVLGATEYLVKPIDHERLQAVLRGLRQARQPGDSSILVVDDDPALRDIMESALTEDGWRVTTAADGSEALAAVERDRPSAIVLDLMMPRTDGFEVLRALRTQHETADLPVIVVTARDLSDEDRARLSGAAQGVILKQALRMDDLQQEIRGMLDEHRGRVNGNRSSAENGSSPP